MSRAFRAEAQSSELDSAKQERTQVLRKVDWMKSCLMNLMVLCHHVLILFGPGFWHCLDQAHQWLPPLCGPFPPEQDAENKVWLKVGSASRWFEGICTRLLNYVTQLSMHSSFFICLPTCESLVFDSKVSAPQIFGSLDSPCMLSHPFNSFHMFSTSFQHLFNMFHLDLFRLDSQSRVESSRIVNFVEGKSNEENFVV